MKLFIKILLFVFIALVTNVNLVNADIAFPNIQEAATSFSFQNEIPKTIYKVIENDLANCCQNELDLVDCRNWVTSIEAVAAKTGGQGGLNLFKFGSKEATSSTGWKTGDRFLKMFDQGSPKLNWKQNSGFLRSEMNLGKPIFDSYRLPNGNLIPTGGFLNAERSLLQSRGWIYSPGKGAWLPPGF